MTGLQGIGLDSLKEHAYNYPVTINKGIGIMLMTELKLTARATAMLTAMRENEGFMTRNELADATGKRNLSPNDIMLLGKLSSAGLIDIENRAASSTQGAFFVYRASEKTENG